MTFDRNESLLPMEIDNGEVIFCASISGGADYHCEMPRQLSLVRRLSNGKELRGRYHLSVESITEQRPEPYNPPRSGEKEE